MISGEQSVRMTGVISAAIRVYGGEERGWDWLRRANPRLNGRTPVSGSETDAGGRLVVELLTQIDEGMYV